MKTFKFKIPIYGIDVTLIQTEKEDTYPSLKKALGFCKVQENEIKDIYDEISRGCTGGGYTYRNFDIRKMLCVFYPFENEKEREEVYAHEKRHIEDRIMKWASVDDIESAGLLAGFLGTKFYEFKKIQLIRNETTNTIQGTSTEKG